MTPLVSIAGRTPRAQQAFLRNVERHREHLAALTATTAGERAFWNAQSRMAKLDAEARAREAAEERDRLTAIDLVRQRMAEDDVRMHALATQAVAHQRSRSRKVALIAVVAALVLLWHVAAQRRAAAAMNTTSTQGVGA